MFADRIKEVWNSNDENASDVGMYSTKEFLKKKAKSALAAATVKREALENVLDSYDENAFYDATE